MTGLLLERPQPWTLAWERDLGALREALNADNPDLSRFKARGGRLILAHGWEDAALTPLATIKYYEQVEARDPRVRDYARLFMMPGVFHCLGGPGPDHVDWPQAITAWVEQGRAPERLIAQKRAPDGSVSNARPLCPYPLQAVYDGSGPSTQAMSYACGTR